MTKGFLLYIRYLFLSLAILVIQIAVLVLGSAIFGRDQFSTSATAEILRNSCLINLGLIIATTILHLAWTIYIYLFKD